jgi:diguanylate cyclase
MPVVDQIRTRIVRAFANASTVEDRVRPLLEVLQFLTELESAYLTRVDLEEGIQEVLFAHNARVLNIPEGLSVPWGDTLCKRALEEGVPYTADVASCWRDSAAARALGIRTYVSRPLRNADGSLFGTLCAASTESRPLTPRGEQVLRLFSTLLEQEIEQEQLVEELHQANAALVASASTDPLTGLPNRRAVFQELQRALAQGQRLGRSLLVAFIDLDGFKAINDRYGHEYGDEFLIEIGRRLSGGLRSGDFLGRVGGDEFVVIGLGGPVGKLADEASEGMRMRLGPLTRGSFILGNTRIEYIGASVGVVSLDPAVTSPEEALKHADAAMYAEKRQRHANCAPADENTATSAT